MSEPYAGDLKIRIGLASETGRRKENEDFVATQPGSIGQRASHGAIAALADGMGGARGGRAAAEIAVGGFIDGFYSQPETIGIERAAARVLEPLNRWVHAQGRADPNLDGMGTTFSALVLRGRTAHVIHVGDSRIYHFGGGKLGGGRLTRLTKDHTLDRPDLSHVLYRAIGIEESLRLDHASRGLDADDRFLLCSDGVHGPLTDRRIAEILARRTDPEEAARRLVKAAIDAGGQDNASAIVVDILTLPETDHASLESTRAGLAVGDPPRPGDSVDGFDLEDILSDGRYSRLFRAHDKVADRRVVLKFPQPRVASDATYLAAFTREAWVASHARCPFVGEILELPEGRQSRLYSVMPFYPGETLEARLLRAPKPSLAEGVDLAIKLCKAVTALHRAGIIHRDIKPKNVILQPDGGLRLLDLGVARVPRLEETPIEEIPGTASYMAPELFAGQAGDEMSDLYALGVTLYRTFAGGAYPYGEIEPFSRPRFRRLTPLARSRPDLPAWLDFVLARSLAVDPGDRYGDVLELAFELENRVAADAVPHQPHRRSLYDRNPLLFWKLASAALALALLISLAWS